MTKPLVFIAPLPAINKRTRLAKMAAVISSQGRSLRFFGWERLAGERDALAHPSQHVTEATLMRGGGYASGRARLLYPVWMIVVFWRVLMLGKGQTIFALGWETAFPACLAAMLTRSTVVFDDADRFSMILRLPGPLNKMLVRLERWTSKRAALHIIPGFSRYEWQHDRMIVLHNAPLLADFETAANAPPQRPDAALVLYANGWIGQTRGAPVFLEAMKDATAKGLDVMMVIAGRVDGPSAPDLIAHPMVKYVGEVSQHEALAWYAVSDAVLTYYDPAVPINRKAESNKWGDAVFFGCPIIVNAEVETAADFVDAGAAWAIAYHDVMGMLDLMETLIDTPEKRQEAAAQLERFTARYPVFDTQLSHIFDMILPESPAS